MRIARSGQRLLRRQHSAQLPHEAALSVSSNRFFIGQLLPHRPQPVHCARQVRRL